MNSSRKSFALVTLLSLLGALISVMLLEQHTVAPRVFGILLVIFLFSPLLLWLKWLKARRILGISFLTSLSGFVVVGSLAMSKFSPALAFGLVLLLLLFRIWRDLSRLNA
jgi:hypothetical protein